jgi:hypothetical protein
MLQTSSIVFQMKEGRLTLPQREFSASAPDTLQQAYSADQIAWSQSLQNKYDQQFADTCNGLLQLARVGASKLQEMDNAAADRNPAESHVVVTQQPQPQELPDFEKLSVPEPVGGNWLSRQFHRGKEQENGYIVAGSLKPQPAAESSVIAGVEEMELETRLKVAGGDRDTSVQLTRDGQGNQRLNSFSIGGYATSNELNLIFAQDGTVRAEYSPHDIP